MRALHLKHWYWKMPGATGCYDWYARTETQARRQIRAHLQLARLPVGFEIWRA